MPRHGSRTEARCGQARPSPLILCRGVTVACIDPGFRSDAHAIPRARAGAVRATHRISVRTIAGVEVDAALTTGWQTSTCAVRRRALERHRARDRRRPDVAGEPVAVTDRSTHTSSRAASAANNCSAHAACSIRRRAHPSAANSCSAHTPTPTLRAAAARIAPTVASSSRVFVSFHARIGDCSVSVWL